MSTFGSADVRLSSSGTHAARLGFLAQEEIVTVVPRFNMDRLDFLSGRYGPFVPQNPTDVPLWLAQLLAEAGQCHVETPPWMKPECLEEWLKSERESAGFQEVPFHYLEVAQALIGIARTDIPDADAIARLLQDINDARDEKIGRAVAALAAEENIDDPPTGWRMPNLSALEVCNVRSTLTHLISTVHVFKNPPPAPPVAHVVAPGAPSAAAATAPAAADAAPAAAAAPGPGDGAQAAAPAAGAEPAADGEKAPKKRRTVRQR
eukprot:TRINITY_DN55541_c0_g1_i1.p1 TRINITY_DN55541_c0_g1~~TRINITY_DN55541_c0_g1_i1.p1  ORF type:complete len:263 (+),score=75.86 TRINITY_DN55541_c0_g1_i1:76-864(+)